MKRVLSLCLCLILLISFSCPAFAATDTPAGEGTVIYREEIDLGNGITLIDEITEYTTGRSSSKLGTRTNTLKDGDTVVGVISFKAVFVYDGTTVFVESKEVTRTATYEGWSYKQNSFTSSGGTVTLDAKLTKLLVLNIPFTMVLTCDPDGNLSH